MEEQIDGGRDILLSHFPDEKIKSIYPPGGQTNSLIKKKVAENHLLLRYAGGGMNSLPTTENSLLETKAYGVGGYAGITEASQMNAWIDDAISSGGWVVEMWHGVGDTDGAATKVNLSLSETDTHLEYVAEKMNDGDLWVATLDEVAIYTTQRLKSRLCMVANNASGMKFTLTDELPDDVYDSELTLNITLPNGVDTVSKIVRNGDSISYKIESGVLTITVLPDGEAIEIIY